MTGGRSSLAFASSVIAEPCTEVTGACKLLNLYPYGSLYRVDLNEYMYVCMFVCIRAWMDGWMGWDGMGWDGMG